MTEDPCARRLRRPEARGKYLYVGTEKLWVRGVTYGTFRPDARGNEYGSRDRVERDFTAIRANGFNAIRTYSVPPRWLLDAAARYGLRVMVGLPWEQHVAFLDEPARLSSIERRVGAGVRSCAGHPAVLAYAVGNEIPAPIVRWHGRRRVERFIERLCGVVRAEDPTALVTYVNYPTTEYLELPFLDLVCFNVYLESQERLAAYLARLQNLVGDRPLVMSEVGLDSRRHGDAAQARSLYRQVRATFAAGGAGAFVFGWTDEWHRGGFDIEDWDFGLTRRDRRPKAALAAVRRAMMEVPFPRDMPLPRISVIVCSYNGARTIRDCLAGLRRLDYPAFEVIVVDDGSNDATPDIAREYGFRVISGRNQGLSHARNVGLRAASGEIVAYIDDDAYPDPDWLRYLAAGFLGSTHVGIGGPNLPPPGDGPVAESVANAPGGPIHVLLSDQEAEHIPGCNMAFRRSALLAIGGFDHAVPDRGRRRGHLLATARARVDARVSARSRRVASPPELGAHLLEAAGGIWPGRGHARAEMAGEVQRRRPHQLGGAPVRVGARAGDSVASRQAVPGHLGRGPVPVPVPAGAGDLRRAPPDAGVVPRDPGPRAALGARERVAPSAGRVAAPGSRGGSAPAPGDARRGARPLHLSRPIVQRAAQALRPDGAPVPPPADGAAAGPSRPRPGAVATARHFSLGLALAADRRPLAPARTHGGGAPGRHQPDAPGSRCGRPPRRRFRSVGPRGATRRARRGAAS